MNRRAVLRSAGAAAAVLAGRSTVADARSPGPPAPPGIAWGHAYDSIDIASIARAHDGGFVVVNRGQAYPEPEQPVRVALLNEDGSVRRRTNVVPDIPRDARYARADITPTERGYAVATGAWVASLDADLTVRTTGFVEGITANSRTFVAELSTGLCVAAQLDRPNHVSTKVLGFGDDAAHRWTRTYGTRNSDYVSFLLETNDGGVVVGGGDPWLAKLAADGTEQWETTLADEAEWTATDATIDETGITLATTTGLARMDVDRSVAWRRSYDRFSDDGRILVSRTPDSGYLLAEMADSDRFRAGKATPDGRLLWTRRYPLGNALASQRVTDVVSPAPGEYLLVTSARNDSAGGAVLLSEAVTPTTPEATRTPTTTPTPATDVTDTSTARPETRTTTTTSPGFGLTAALAGGAGVVARWLARRR